MMYKLGRLLLVGSILTAAMGAVFSADTYQVDTAHSFMNFKVKRAVTSNLLQHMLEKRNTGVEMRLTAAIQVKHYIDLGFQGITTDICTAI